MRAMLWPASLPLAGYPDDNFFIGDVLIGLNPEDTSSSSSIGK